MLRYRYLLSHTAALPSVSGKSLKIFHNLRKAIAHSATHRAEKTELALPLATATTKEYAVGGAARVTIFCAATSPS